MSQNDKQKEENENYSYTIYDEHGRTTEVGQIENLAQPTDADTQSFKFAVASGLLDRDIENNRIYTSVDQIVNGSMGLIGLASLFGPAKGMNKGKSETVKSWAIYVGIKIATELAVNETEKYLSNPETYEKLGNFILENDLVEEVTTGGKKAVSYLRYDKKIIQKLIDKAGSLEELLNMDPKGIVAPSKAKAIENVLKIENGE